MTPDQLARATAALDVWWERDRTPWWLTRTRDQHELESMHTALEAPDTDAALEAVGATTGTYLSTPEQDAWNRATMSELRQALREAQSQADVEPGENRPSRHQEPASESPDRGMSQLRTDDAGLTGDPGSWVQSKEVDFNPCLDPRSPDPESVARVEWEAGPDEDEPGLGALVLTGGHGQVPERAYQLGDLVEDVQTGETWTVDDCRPGNSQYPARVTLGREAREGAVVTDCLASQIHLVTPWAERPVYPGDGWSDHVMLRQTGQALTEFCAKLPDPSGDPAA